MKIHPSDLALEELRLPRESGRGPLLNHLLNCERCRERLRELPSLPAVHDEGTSDLGHLKPVHEYGGSLERIGQLLGALERRMRREREEAPGLFIELMEYPARQQEFLLRNSVRFHTWGLFELLIERSWESIRSPVRCEELARLALRLADHLDTTRYKAELIEDLKARAWSYVGNAHRLRSDLLGGTQAFETAYAHLKQGTREPMERAMFIDLKASLLRDQRRFGEAVRLLRRAVEIFLEDGELHRAGRSLVNLSTVYNYAGQPEESITVLRQSLDLIDPSFEPHLLLGARHNLMFVLADLGRFIEAHGLYRGARPLYREHADSWLEKRRKWLKGKIMYGLGRTQACEALFLEAREGFIAEDAPYDTALISLELAVLYAAQGRTVELKQLAEEIVPIFASRQIHRETLAALTFLWQAAEAENATLEVVTRVFAFLKRAQYDPALRFEAPAG